MKGHNHITRVILERGQCLACDDYHYQELEQRLAEAEKWKEEWQITPLWKVFENNKSLTAQLKEAEAVIDDVMSIHDWATVLKRAREYQAKWKTER